MRAVHFDPFSGASGDMILGALADAGADLAALGARLSRALPFAVDLRALTVRRGGLAGTRVRVEVTEDDPPRRRLRDILDILAAAELPTRVREGAGRTFARLAEAEAAVHGTSPDEVHFHEAGAADAIVDVTGAHWLLDDLDVGRVTSGPVAVGSGTVKCAHGELPLPAPATAKLLEGVPVVLLGGRGEAGCGRELTTPTGAALLTTLAESFGPAPAMRLERTGYGFGERKGEGLPNALRVFLGEIEPPLLGREDEVAVLETTVDDMPGEWIGHLHDSLARRGALEVTAAPVGMKKSRPGVRLTVVARAGDARSLAEAILRESTTFGVRFRTERRLVLDRETREVETPWGKVHVKVGRLGKPQGAGSPAGDAEASGEVVQASPEYEDCARLAEAAGVPLKAVYEAALAAYRRAGS